MVCPLCKKSRTHILTRVLRDGSKGDVYLCPVCELGILNVKDTEQELKKFYAQEYRKKRSLTSYAEPERLFTIYSKFQSDRLRLLKPYFSKKKRLLEVGCSAGMFLFHAKKEVKEVVGIDYDESSAHYAAKKCGCTVYTTEISKTPLTKHSFDSIVAFQTLEHVRDPEAFITELTEYLAPGGVIAIEVPNLYDVLAHVYDLPHHWKFFYHRAHLWYFTQKSLESLMKKCGVRGKTHHIQDYNVMNHIHWVLRDEPQSTGVPGLSAPVFPFKQGAPTKTQRALSHFITTADAEYKKLLADHHITSNILFIGKKKHV